MSTRIKCLHCRKLTSAMKLLNDQYCPDCVELRVALVFRNVDTHLRGARRCLIPGCINHTDEGCFVGDLCSPCHSYVIANKGTYSQAYRNEVAKTNLRSISKMTLKQDNHQ